MLSEGIVEEGIVVIDAVWIVLIWHHFLCTPMGNIIITNKNESLYISEMGESGNFQSQKTTSSGKGQGF